MHCWNCGAEIEIPERKLSFRASCEACGAWQHACRNCQYYKEGAPHSCTVPGIEPVRDKEKMNYCEEFKALGQQLKSADPKEAARRLFGENEEDEQGTASPFDRLFGSD
jgi:hypothetical protein